MIKKIVLKNAIFISGKKLAARYSLLAAFSLSFPPQIELTTP